MKTSSIVLLVVAGIAGFMAVKATAADPKHPYTRDPLGMIPGSTTDPNYSRWWIRPRDKKKATYEDWLAAGAPILG
jgi:hypothetical protein